MTTRRGFFAAMAAPAVAMIAAVRPKPKPMRWRFVIKQGPIVFNPKVYNLLT
jgi:hypothetical protein